MCAKRSSSANLPTKNDVNNEITFDEIKCQAIVLRTETYATVPANITRKKIGVGERVQIWLRPNVNAPIVWMPPLSGTLSATSGQIVTFTAADHTSLTVPSSP